MDEIFAEAVRRLENLPTTDAIADELVSMGIKAEPSCAYACVLAEYFLQETGRFVDVTYSCEPGAAGPTRITKGWVFFEGGHEVELSAKLGLLAFNFDMRMYPKLER